jgi:pimeloyl-ACP methyl ester carboxylesterase
MLSSTPTSHFLNLPNRPIVRENGEITQDSLQLHYWQWQGHQPTVLICHGGMLHGRCYDRIINEALTGYHVIALDFRGHGRSQKHPIPYPFPWFGEDLLQFIEYLNLSKNNLLGIGHSLGGYAITLAAALASKQLFHSILLLDPGIYSSDIYKKDDRNLRKHSTIINQKNQWLSIEDMISYMDTSDRLGHWPKDTLRDYCTYALDENFKLQCTPEIAAYIYRASIQSESDIYSIVKNSTFINQIPIHVVRAARSFINNRIPVMPVASDLANWFTKGRDIYLKDVSHSFPTEQPEIVVNLVKQMLEETFLLNNLK